MELCYTNFIQNCNDLEAMREAGSISEYDYLQCANTLNQDIQTRLGYAYDLININKEYFEAESSLYKQFIASKGLENEFYEFIKSNDILNIKYVESCIALINQHNYLKSKGESLTKQQLDDFIKAKEIIRQVTGAHNELS